MARTKSSQTETKAKSAKATVNENDELIKKLEEMQKQLAELKAENESLKEENIDNIKEEEEEEELNGDTEITVISQTLGSLAISTEGNGVGNVYRFSHFGEAQDIPFSDLKDIVKNKRRFATEGAYYIANKQAVKKLRLTKDYEKIINEKLFEHILDENSSVIVKAYENAPKMQQEQIVGMIEDRLAQNKDIDGNVLVKIGKLCGKNFLLANEDDDE